MPVQRYRDVSEMPPPPETSPANLGRRIRVVWARAVALSEFRARPGVQRFRSIEEADAAREQETTERVQQLRALRQARTQ